VLFSAGSAGVSPALLLRIRSYQLSERRKGAGATPALPALSLMEDLDVGRV
jgi:hypothetical protein